MVVPSPICPLELKPQHFAASETTAQVNSWPALIAVTPEVRVDTEVGVVELVVVPLPSCP